jgi:hypothetical protein
MKAFVWARLGRDGDARLFDAVVAEDMKNRFA